MNGNVDQNKLIDAYKKSHFCILPSMSEGWPKAIAEGMFFGCVPIVTRVSCVPWMLNNGKRGILIRDFHDAVNSIEIIIKNPDIYLEMSKNAFEWSRQYTLEEFEKAIAKLL